MLHRPESALNIAAKIADHFKTTEDAIHFEDCAYFWFSRSCTVKFSGVWFDVWFDASYNISNVAEAT